MLVDLIRALLAAVLVGIVPGYFWARCLVASSDRAERLVYSIALSITLVPAVALVPARLLGMGVTPSVAALSVLLVLGTGFAAYRAFGPAKGSDEPIASRPTPLGLSTLILLIAALAVLLWGFSDLVPTELGAPLIALLVLVGGGAYLLASLRRDEPASLPEEENAESRAVVRAARYVLLPVVLLLVLLRGYPGVVQHDWPFIRGVDHYSHTVMANLMLTEGEIEPYLIYPPGFHTTIAVVSRFSGLEPLDIFPVLGPALLLLPPLALYALARRLWGWECGVAAALFSGLLLNSTYYYFNDSMYPNLVTAQFLLVLAIAALVQLYTSPSARTGLMVALLGSSVVLYHQVSSLYLALLLAVPVAAFFLPYLLLRERRKGLALLLSLALLGVLSILYAWDTYNLPRIIGGLLDTSKASTTTTAVGMAIGTQLPQGFDRPLETFSPLVLLLGLFGAVLLVVDGKRAGAPYTLARITLLAWGLLLFAGSRTALSGFPQRFERDLGIPLALLAALAFVAVLRSLRLSRPVAVSVASLAVLLIATLAGFQAVRNLEKAAGPSFQLVMTPQISAAGEWLREHNNGGNIMVSPHLNQVPSRAMLAMGGYSALQSFELWQVEEPRDLPPGGPGPMWDVLWVMQHPEGERTRQLLEKYDVRYIVLYKEFPGRFTADYWQLFKARPDLYQVVFENEEVLIVTRRETA